MARRRMRDAGEGEWLGYTAFGSCRGYETDDSVEDCVLPKAGCVPSTLQQYFGLKFEGSGMAEEAMENIEAKSLGLNGTPLLSVLAVVGLLICDAKKDAEDRESDAEETVEPALLFIGDGSHNQWTSCSLS